MASLRAWLAALALCPGLFAQAADSAASVPFSGTFEVKTDNGAVVDVYVNGVRAGRTPYVSGAMPVGIYRVSFLPPVTPPVEGRPADKGPVIEAVRNILGADTTADFARTVAEMERIAQRQMVVKNGQKAELVFGIGEIIKVVKAEKSSNTRIYAFGILIIVGLLSAVGFLVFG